MKEVLELLSFTQILNISKNTNIYGPVRYTISHGQYILFDQDSLDGWAMNIRISIDNDRIKLFYLRENGSYRCRMLSNTMLLL